MLLLLVLILFYHIIFELILKLKLWIQSRNQSPTPQSEHEDSSDTGNDQTPLVAPTCTIIDAPPPGEIPLSAIIEAEGKTEQNQANETEL